MVAQTAQGLAMAGGTTMADGSIAVPGQEEVILGGLTGQLGLLLLQDHVTGSLVAARY